jgi:hypothetical protein
VNGLVEVDGDSEPEGGNGQKPRRRKAAGWVVGVFKILPPEAWHKLHAARALLAIQRSAVIPDPAPTRSTDREALITLREDGAWNGYRKVYCALYEPCLDVAVAEKWHGFSCRGCKVEVEIEDARRKAEERIFSRGIEGISHVRKKGA